MVPALQNVHTNNQMVCIILLTKDVAYNYAEDEQHAVR
jgi:hypothetical protein